MISKGLLPVLSIFMASILYGPFLDDAGAQSLYRPGMVRAEKGLRAPLEPPEQPEGKGSWVVEPDIELHHFSKGKGARHVLVVHGGPGFPFPTAWPGLDPLENDFTVHYYHQRGCGKSTRPIEKFESSNYFANMMTLDRTLGLGAQIADIERIRRILDTDRLVLVAHSFGAVFACLYAAEFPGRLDALVLVAPAGAIKMPLEGMDTFEEIGRRLPEEKKESFAAFRKEYLDFGNIFSRTEKELSMLNGRFGEFYTAAMGKKAAESAVITDQDQIGGWIAFAVYFSMGMRYDYRGALKDVKAPVLVIHGKEDLQPETVSQMYVECFPNACLKVIEEASHFPFEEKPEAFGRIVHEFLTARVKSAGEAGDGKGN